MHLLVVGSCNGVGAGPRANGHRRRDTGATRSESLFCPEPRKLEFVYLERLDALILFVETHEHYDRLDVAAL